MASTFDGERPVPRTQMATCTYSRIFTAFQRASNLPAVVLADQAVFGLKAHGARTLEVLADRNLIWGEDADRPVSVAFRALACVRIPLTKMAIRFDNFGWDIFCLASNSATKEAAQCMFRTLRTFHICSNSPHYVSAADGIDTAVLFGACASLERLMISSWVMSNPYIII